MPQDVEFYMPFPPGISPDVDGARERSVAWARERELITCQADEKRVRAWDIAGLMARWVPEATGPDLDLTINPMVTITMLDDQFDSPQGWHPEQAARIHEHFVALSRPGSATVPHGPLARGVKEAWDRMFAGASPEWAWHASEHHRWYLDGTLEEVVNSHHRAIPTLSAYFEQRRKGSGYVYPMLDMSQKAYGFEVPVALYDDPTISRMMEIAADFVDTVNDVHSLEKEEARGLHWNNMVYVIMHGTGCGRDESIARVVEMIDSWTREFVELERLVPDDAVTLRFVDCLRSSIRGYHDWSTTTARYARPVPSSEPAYRDVLRAAVIR